MPNTNSSLTVGDWVEYTDGWVAQIKKVFMDLGRVRITINSHAYGVEYMRNLTLISDPFAVGKFYYWQKELCRITSTKEGQNLVRITGYGFSDYVDKWNLFSDDHHHRLYLHGLNQTKGVQNAT